MRTPRRTTLAWIALAGLLGAMLGPAVASADPLTDWTPGPGATGDDTYQGSIDSPATNATVATGNFTVSGWFVDTTAQGWAGADDIEVWLGTMDGGGNMLAKAQIAQSRPDVAAAEGNPYFGASGFTAIVPGASVPAGQETLSVYAHTPGNGWWYKQVNVNASEAVSPVAGPAPANPPTGALPTIVVEQPTSSETLQTKNAFQIVGYAFDPAATANQGSQGSGIDKVSVYVDAEPQNGGMYIGDADLGFSDAAAGNAYGPQFAASGFRLTFKPTAFHSGAHQLFIYAHSAVTGKTGLALQSFTVQENG